MERVLRVQDADVAKAKAKAKALAAQRARGNYLQRERDVRQWRGINVKQLPLTTAQAHMHIICVPIR